MCEVLEIDKDKLLVANKQGTQKYRDARLIIAHALRNNVTFTKVILGTTADGKRKLMEVDQPITYQHISDVLLRKRAQSAMASEMACKYLMDSNKDFKEQYDKVSNIFK